MAKRRKPFTGYASDKARRRKDAGPSSRVVREPVAIESPAPASTLGSARHEAPRLRRGHGGKFLIPAATVGVMGGAGYAVHRHRKGSTVTKADTYLERVGKAVSGPRGANHPDRVMGAPTPMIGQTRKVGALVPTGKHVSHANKLERHTPLPGYRKQPSGKNAQRLLRVKGGGRDRAAGEYKGKLVVATKADAQPVEKASTKPFQSFGAGRANAKQGFKVKRGGTLRYRAGQASADNRVVAGTAVGSTAGVGAAVHHRRKRSEVGKASDFVARIGLIDVDRVQTYGRQVGRRGSNINKALKLRGPRKVKPSRYNDRNTAISQDTNFGGRPLAATAPKHWLK